MTSLADLKWLPAAVMITAILGGITGIVTVLTTLPLYRALGPAVSIGLVAGLIYATGIVLRVSINEATRRRQREQLLETVAGRQETEELDITDDVESRTCYSYTVTVEEGEDEMTIREIRYRQKPVLEDHETDRIPEFDALLFSVSGVSELEARVEPDPESQKPENPSLLLREGGRLFKSGEQEEPEQVPLSGEKLKNEARNLFAHADLDFAEQGRPFFQLEPGHLHFVVPYDNQLYEPDRVRNIKQVLLRLRNFLEEQTGD